MFTTPVFALIDRDRRIVRATDGFRSLGTDVTTACEASPDIERVLSGVAQSASLVVGETQVQISAVADQTGTPHAFLSLPPTGAPAGDPHTAPADSDDWVGRLRASVEQSPVLAWLKDPAGRHLYVNRRYAEALQVAEDRLLGHTDDELSPAETVDGPRRSLAEDGIEEPQELEYTVPAFGHRPAFAAVRFLVRDTAGQAVGQCGLAGPLDQAQLVRQEADRIGTAERSGGTDPSRQRDELLREWGVVPLDGAAQAAGEEFTPEAMVDGATPPTEEGVGPEFELAAAEDPTPPPAPPALEKPSDLVQSWEECVQHLQTEAGHWQDEIVRSRSAVQEAEERLAQALAERDAAQQEHDRLRGERAELERALTAERARSEELVRTIEQLRVQISDVGRTIEHALPGEDESSPAGLEPQGVWGAG